MTKTFLVDIDETVLAYSDEFQFWMEARGYRSRHRLRDRYEIGETFDICDEEAVKLIREFYDLPLFGRLRCEPDARIVLSDYHRRGYRMIAVSAADVDLVDRRRQNLEAEFGFSWEVHCVGTRGCKRDVLSRFTRSFWVDDHSRHALTGAEVGHRTFLIDRHHNRPLVDARVERVSDWFEIRERIEGGEVTLAA